MSENERFRHLPDYSDVHTHRQEIRVPSEPQLQELSDDVARLHDFDVLSNLVWTNIDKIEKDNPIPDHILIPGKEQIIEIPGIH